MSEPTLYRRGKPQFEEPVHWERFDELVRAGVVVPVEPDADAMAEALWESETPVLGFEQPWADQPEATKDDYREAARRVWSAGIGGSE